jgi:putative ATPase
LIKEQILINFNVDEETRDIVEQMQNIEQKFFTDKENPLFNWNQVTIQKTFEEKNLQVQTLTQKFKEKRKITSQEIQTWFSSNSAYGANLQTKLGVENLQKIINLLEKAAPETIFDWQNEISFFVICPNA